MEVDTWRKWGKETCGSLYKIRTNYIVHSGVIEKRYRIFVWHSHKEKWDSFGSTEGKMCDCPRNLGVWRNKEGCNFRSNNRKYVWQPHKIRSVDPIKIWRKCVAVHTWRKGVKFTKKKEKKWFRQSATLHSKYSQ